MFKKIQVRIYVKAFHPFYINRLVVLIKKEAKNSYINRIKNIFLPRKIEKFTVLRSPHVDKKARDQFERIKHKRLLEIVFPYGDETKLKSAYHFLKFLQKVSVGVSIIYKLQIKS